MNKRSFVTVLLIDDLEKSHKIDGTEKSSRCKARESFGIRRTNKRQKVQGVRLKENQRSSAQNFSLVPCALCPKPFIYVAMTKDEAQRRPSALLRAVSLSNGR